MTTQEEGLALDDPDIALAQLHTPGPGALDFPALQAEAGLITLLDEVVVTRLFVEGDVGLSGFGFGFGRHGLRV